MATTHFSGPVAVGAGSIKTLTGAHTVTANENGTTFVLNAAAGAAITLPAPAAGLRYTFVTGLAFATTDWVITATGAIMNGNVMEAGVVQVITGATTLNLELAAEAVGDHISLISDGTLWYVSGSLATAASITPA